MKRSGSVWVTGVEEVKIKNTRSVWKSNNDKYDRGVRERNGEYRRE